MRPLSLNLARQPFANSRPVTRATLILWVAGAVLFGLNIFFYWSHFSGEGQSERTMRDITASIEAEKATIARLESEVGEFDLDGQNELVRFLNEKIAERTFSWSALFDDLAEVLPGDVQLERVSPRISGREKNRRRRRSIPDQEIVTLTLAGTAKDGEEMLAFVDALFAHPSFREPNPTGETRREEGMESGFALNVLYLPRRPTDLGAPLAEQPVAAAAPAEDRVADRSAEMEPVPVGEDGAEAEPSRPVTNELESEPIRNRRVP